jgi:hypothetical protein
VCRPRNAVPALSPEDLSSGVSIADLTFNDFRIDLSGYLREQEGRRPDQGRRLSAGPGSALVETPSIDATPPALFNPHSAAVVP